MNRYNMYSRSLTAAVILAACLHVTGSAATLCVTPAGTSGCFATISSAVASASANDTVTVSPGTYTETVTITKSLSLIAKDGAIIDATGLPQGIFINGLAGSAIQNVVISGFTVQNANFEGILIVNASAVTVTSNSVLNNNKGLAGGACPGLPAFETLEQSDCGEGIHLLGTDHSIITNNTIQGNSGGILLADDTGATHDNLISFNTVQDNAYACGITMASHPPAMSTGSSAPLGVYHNTVYGNRSARNGLANGGGAGVGIFASVPGAAAYGNVVVDNLVHDNGLPGVAMHAHVPGQNLNDNMIVGNTVVDNGADSGQTATPGPTGINLFAAGVVTGNIISGNMVQSENVDVAVSTRGSVQVQANSLLGTQTGLANLGTGTVIGTANWWGCDKGPLASGCSSIQGSNVQSNWLFTPIPAQPVY